MSEQREITLNEWCEKLSDFHIVNKELSALRSQVSALQAENEVLRKAMEPFAAEADLFGSLLSDGRPAYWDAESGMPLGKLTIGHLRAARDSLSGTNEASRLREGAD